MSEKISIDNICAPIRDFVSKLDRLALQRSWRERSLRSGGHRRGRPMLDGGADWGRFRLQACS